MASRRQQPQQHHQRGLQQPQQQQLQSDKDKDKKKPPKRPAGDDNPNEKNRQLPKRPKTDEFLLHVHKGREEREFFTLEEATALKATIMFWCLFFTCPSQVASPEMQSEQVSEVNEAQ